MYSLVGRAGLPLDRVHELKFIEDRVALLLSASLHVTVSQSPCHCLPVPMSLSASPYVTVCQSLCHCLPVPMSLSASPHVTVWQTPCHCLPVPIWQSPCHCQPVPLSLSALSARCIICLGPDITLCCGLGSEHLPTNKLITCQHLLLVSVPLKRKVCSRYWLWTVHFGEQAHFISYLLFWRCVHLFHWDFGEWSVNSCVFYIVQHISTCVPHISEFLWSSLHMLSMCECPRALCAVFCCCWCCFSAGIRLLTLCCEVYCNEISSGWVWGMG